jgi:hypothetical protein
MSDSDFHNLVMGHPIEEPPKTVTFSARLDVDVYAHITCIAQYFGSNKTFVVQTLLKSAIAHLYASTNLGEVEANAEAYLEHLKEGK